MGSELGLSWWPQPHPEPTGAGRELSMQDCLRVLAQGPPNPVPSASPPPSALSSPSLQPPVVILFLSVTLHLPSPFLVINRSGQFLPQFTGYVPGRSQCQSTRPPWSLWHPQNWVTQRKSLMPSVFPCAHLPPLLFLSSFPI